MLRKSACETKWGGIISTEGDRDIMQEELDDIEDTSNTKRMKFNSTMHKRTGKKTPQTILYNFITWELIS